MHSSSTLTRGQGLMLCGGFHCPRGWASKDAQARPYLVSPHSFTSPMRPYLTASHVVGVLETRSQYIDQALLKLTILLLPFSPVLRLRVLCHDPRAPWHLPNQPSMHYSLLPSALPLPQMCPSSRLAVSAPPHPL